PPMSLAPHPEGRRPELTDALALPPDSLPSKPGLVQELDAARDRLEAGQAALGAEGKRSLLVVLQGRDAAGKDGAIRRIFSGLNPALCSVTTFKKPTPLELRHDFLWRVHQAIPPRGVIGIFNRSHYEDVLVVRVRALQPESVWRPRYDHINDFERLLADEGTVIRKFYLHISREEQRKRLEERLDDPTKNWKFEAGDLEERSRWDEYTAAYEEMLERTSTSHAPWYIVPADKNKARDLLIARVLVQTLEEMNPAYPPADPQVMALRGTFR
ncbi:MAG TPA: PPK2 family polyphosphate kinase, partial [Gemmatimonadales bacterium]